MKNSLAFSIHQIHYTGNSIIQLFDRFNCFSIRNVIQIPIKVIICINLFKLKNIIIKTLDLNFILLMSLATQSILYHKCFCLTRFYQVPQVLCTSHFRRWSLSKDGMTLRSRIQNECSKLGDHLSCNICWDYISWKMVLNS